jgi:hypothetical protein
MILEIYTFSVGYGSKRALIGSAFPSIGLAMLKRNLDTVGWRNRRISSDDYSSWIAG